MKNTVGSLIPFLHLGLAAGTYCEMCWLTTAGRRASVTTSKFGMSCARSSCSQRQRTGSFGSDRPTGISPCLLHTGLSSPDRLPCSVPRNYGVSRRLRGSSCSSGLRCTVGYGPRTGESDMDCRTATNAPSATRSRRRASTSSLVASS